MNRHRYWFWHFQTLRPLHVLITRHPARSLLFLSLLVILFRIFLEETVTTKMKNLLVSLLLAASLQGLDSQLPLPHRPLGFVYNGGEPSAPVHLEAFVDMLCPDCQQAFPVIEKLAQVYGPSTLRLTLQLFPLPYHTNAFITAQSVLAVAKSYNSSVLFRWMETVFKEQSQLYNFATMDKTRFDIVNIIIDMGSKIGIDRTTMKNGLSSAGFAEQAVISWKYGCSRTVAGTPYFFINGIFASQASSSWSVEQWKQLIDPLLEPQENN